MFRKIFTKKREWPDADPPDKSDPYWEFNNNLNLNGTQYKKVEVEAGKWQWKVDEEIEKYKRDEQLRKDNLYWALRSRVLTAEEMAEIERLGASLIIREMVPYKESEKQKELNDALLQQFLLRQIAENKALSREPAL